MAEKMLEKRKKHTSASVHPIGLKNMAYKSREVISTTKFASETQIFVVINWKTVHLSITF